MGLFALFFLSFSSSPDLLPNRLGLGNMYAPKTSSREAHESDKRRSQSALPDYKQIETRVSSLLKKLVESDDEKYVYV